VNRDLETNVSKDKQKARDSQEELTPAETNVSTPLSTSGSDVGKLVEQKTKREAKDEEMEGPRREGPNRGWETGATVSECRSILRNAEGPTCRAPSVHALRFAAASMWTISTDANSERRIVPNARVPRVRSSNAVSEYMRRSVPMSIS
jgi:hypothetical protein